MNEMKKVLVIDIDDDIEGVIIHHPSGDQEIVVLGSGSFADDDGAEDGAEEQT